jgi:hypothetical protein
VTFVSKYNPGKSLGSYLGRKDQQHLAAFSASGVRARKNHPRQCEALNRNPPYARCACVARIGSKFCVSHLPFRDQVALDNVRRPQLLKIIETATWEGDRKNAQDRLDAIERRAWRFHQLNIDPRSGPVMIRFACEKDRAKCEAWLKAQGFDLNALSPISGEPLSALAKTRCLFAAMRHVIKKSIDEEKALRGVKRAHRLDKVFFDKLSKASGEP